MRALASLSAFALAAVSLPAVSAVAAVPPAPAAQAWAVRVVLPGSGAVVSSAATGGPFAYPADGSVVSMAATTVSTAVGPPATATARALSVSLLGRAVTAAAAVGAARADKAAAGSDGSAVSGLVVLGERVEAARNQRFRLGGWGTLTTLEQGAAAGTAAAGAHGFVVALDLVLRATHAGLPAGAEIQVGYAEARAGADPLPPPPGGHGGIRAPTATPSLGDRGDVFPVAGTPDWGDTFGAFRGDEPGGWHHGDDLFAPSGTPVVACADGTVFSVGWNKLGGRRLWLRDARGNEFYYAHLSGYAPLAVDGTQVRAGDVLGFVGASGDAEGTPPHLHFEIHPVRLLGRGYDGAVDPTGYLRRWRRPVSVRLDAATGLPSAVHVPPTGVVLLRTP
ncbi:MAG TPA: M23 family metallopeptidase [Gaiellaceae bacterium]|nr:M23 family metallopeptidase [Gaiellaceae bacterium]